MPNLSKKTRPISVAGPGARSILSSLTEEKRAMIFKEQEEDEKRYAAEREDKLTNLQKITDARLAPSDKK